MSRATCRLGSPSIGTFSNWQTLLQGARFGSKGLFRVICSSEFSLLCLVCLHWKAIRIVSVVYTGKFASHYTRSSPYLRLRGS